MRAPPGRGSGDGRSYIAIQYNPELHLSSHGFAVSYSNAAACDSVLSNFFNTGIASPCIADRRGNGQGIQA